MSIKKDYYTMEKDKFNSYLNNIKNTSSTKVFFKDSNQECFFYNEDTLNERLTEIEKWIWLFDQTLNSFSEFGRKQIIQSYLIDEINSTNNIENIYSTKHDIFNILNNFSKADYSKDTNKKIVSICNSYKLLLTNKAIHIDSLQSIRTIYDNLILETLEKNDFPDGVLFRKNNVYISDGIKNVHSGFYPEEKINSSLKEFLDFYNDTNINIYIRIIIFHYLLEDIHPFYDGNGRLGRFLMTNKLYEETNSYFSFLLSKALNNNKNLYYSSFKKASDIHSFGSLNDYCIDILDILIKEIKNEIQELIIKKEVVNKLLLPSNIKGNERKILSIINEASILSDFGISNEEIVSVLGISKRSLIYSLNSLKDKSLIEEIKLGKYNLYLNK